MLEIFRLSEIDYIVSMTGEIFAPSDGTLTCIATHDPFIVDEPDGSIHLFYPTSGTVEIMNARTLCLLIHFATLKDLCEALEKHEDVPYVLCDRLK